MQSRGISTKCGTQREHYCPAGIRTPRLGLGSTSIGQRRSTTLSRRRLQSRHSRRSSDRLAAVLFAAIASGAFVWAATRRSVAPAVVITSASAALAAETVQWSPLLGAAYGIPWLGVLLCAKPTIGFAIWVARPTRIALVGSLVLLAVSLALLPTWPADWFAAIRHTSLATAGGTPYLAPIGTPGGVLAAALLLRWRRPEARLVLALACMPQTPLLYETVPLFLVPVSIAEGGVLWLGSWLAALWVSQGGPYANDLNASPSRHRPSAGASTRRARS